MFGDLYSGCMASELLRVCAPGAEFVVFGSLFRLLVLRTLGEPWF